ncbi:amidohydrolase family protein [Prevotella sp. kh1p2]|uniref:amidohydrolase family protein n=1 Tax=Prevotella sp. kh1p2 TaxID=1761883 RepID=UPI0008B6EEC4|nr:amidohydrolase family protein [Prevotella sp. kh1p2]SES75120.1 Predicted metal-dependent hydrolase, TIM-barrel fold [Prevotella sp. kh1p2]SNU10537.1 Predicted metal-dependent hydrolase, TIM-barrel fold [Prevotellaceae bacterium KH2P17]
MKQNNRKNWPARLALALAAIGNMQGAGAQGIIDVHSHIITGSYRAELQANGAEREEGFPLPAWSVADQLAFMDSAGIRTAVLTLSAPQPYFGNAARAAACIRKVNEESAAVKAAYPGRFLFCAALPLPNVEAALREVSYALDTLHADGIKLATNSRGQYLGDAELDPLMAELNRRHAVVILHPHKPEPYSASLMAGTPLAMQEYLAETTRAVANMITHNVMGRYPQIKFVIPHCGAYLPIAVPRMKSLTAVMQQNKLIGTVDWEQSLASLYYDLAGSHSAETVRELLTITTPDHILYGSDYPYVAPKVLEQGLQRMKSYLDANTGLARYSSMFLYGNAERLFGLSKGEAPKPVMADSMLVRLSEIEVYPEYLDAYLQYAANVGGESVRKEPGVVCIYPMQVSADSCQIRIVEIYRNLDAYHKHIASEHFQRYKQGTLKMVKSLKLVDMRPLAPDDMPVIFSK